MKRPYVFEEEYYPGSTSDSGTVTAEVVYVGYGITAPELGYDDYAGVDVKGKIVMMEPEVPVTPDPDVELFRKWRPYSFHDYKVQNAAKHGAGGPRLQLLHRQPELRLREGLRAGPRSGRRSWDDLFAGTGKKHDEVVKAIRSTRKPASFDMGKMMTIEERHRAPPGGDRVERRRRGSPGTDPVLKQEAIVIGAHLDHLGMNDRADAGRARQRVGRRRDAGRRGGAGDVGHPAQAVDRVRRCSAPRSRA